MKDMLPRLIRLKHAEVKIRGQIETLVKISGKDKHQVYKLNRKRKILEEYKTSIYNLETYGWEKAPNGHPVSVDINVPSNQRG